VAAALEFRIDLSGNLVEALNKGGNALERTGEHAKHAKHEFSLFEAEAGKLSGSIGGLELNLSALGKGGSLFTFDLAEGLRSAYEIAEKFVDKITELGKEAIGTAAKTQDLNLAIRENIGPERAKAVDELAESFQRTTRFSPSDMKRALLPLIKEGVGDKDTLDTVATIATDMAARNAGGIADVQQTISSFAGIFQRGRVKPQQLAQFGIQANDYFAALASSLGVSTQAAAKLAKAGKVSQDKLADIAINLIARRQGGAIGGPSLDAAKTLGASLERLQHVGENLFERIADSPGMQAVQGFLDNFIATMQGPIGTDLVNMLSDAFKSLFGDLSGPQGLAKVRGEIKDAVEYLKGVWPDIKAGADGVWTVFKGIAKTVGTIVDGWRQIHDFFKDFDSGRINKDIIDTIRGDHGGIAKDTINDNSPDWKKKRAAAALGLPAFASGGIVDGPTIALIGENGPEAIVPLSDPSLSSTASFGAIGGGRGDTTIQVGGIRIEIAAGAGADGREVGLLAAQTARVELKKILDEIGWAYGATVLE